MKWLIPFIALFLVGCSVKKVSDAEPITKLTDEQLREAAKRETIPLNPTSVSLAETTVAPPKLQSVLTAVGNNHSYHVWNKEFLTDTENQIKELASGEILESSMFTQTGNGLEEVQIRFIKKADGHVIVRLTTSNPDLAKKLQTEIDSAKK